jgi:2-amino-4-hydroxy-6-hydroxymethyldihydropteridine diphosphokinase
MREPEERVYIGLGSNLGDRAANLAAARDRMKALEDLEVVRASPVYETAPMGPPQPMYLNAALEVQTALAPRALLRELKGIERSMGRAEGPRWGPRVIDLDILYWGRTVVADPDLQVPHLRLHHRAFALVPLAELCPDGLHPILHQTLEQLRQQLPPLQRHADFPAK